MASKKRKTELVVKRTLQKYFEFVEKNSELGTGKLKCLVPGCHGKLLTYEYNNGWCNHERHLKIVHKLDPGELNPPLAPGLEGFGFVASNDNISNKGTWKRSDPRQAYFEENLLDLICISGVAWNLSSQLPFVRLVRKVLKKKLEDVEHEQLHLSLDHWSTRRHSSILGIRCHFIDSEWKLQNYTVGLMEFPWRKTSINVRNVFKNFISEELKVNPEQIGIIMTDNASEMRAVFSNIAQTEEDDEIGERETECETDWVDIQECDLNEDDEEFLQTILDADRLESDQNYNQLMEECIDWSRASLERRGCLTHALHLTVMECLKNNPAADSLVNYLKKLVGFFSMSTYWHAKLMAKTGKELIKPGQTRWNSVLAALNRLLEEGFLDDVNAIIAEAKSEAGDRYHGPVAIDNVLKEQIVDLSNLLTPFLTLTNSLQGDGVTSSLAIPGVIGLYKAVAATQCETDYMRALRSSLCLAVTERFARDETFIRTGRGKNKALLKIFDSESHILATILDPRLKTVPFKIPLEENYLLKMYVPSVDKVTSLLKMHYDKILSTHQIPSTVAESAQNTPLKSNPSSNLIFGPVHAAVEDQVRRNKELVNEVENYLAEAIIPDTACPLNYWRKASKSFPVLSRLAKKFLAIPASSG
ncbi:unnamed protein product, partial [Allacma fusca]